MSPATTIQCRLGKSARPSACHPSAHFAIASALQPLLQISDVPDFQYPSIEPAELTLFLEVHRKQMERPSCRAQGTLKIAVIRRVGAFGTTPTITAYPKARITCGTVRRNFVSGARFQRLPPNGQNVSAVHLDQLLAYGKANAKTPFRLIER
jgi:hypothetical protein